MTTYYATIRHHSIARARVIKIEGDLTKAKQAATREFGGEQRDYNLTIVDDNNDTVAFRPLYSKRWINTEI